METQGVEEAMQAFEAMVEIERVVSRAMFTLYHDSDYDHETEHDLVKKGDKTAIKGEVTLTQRGGIIKREREFIIVGGHVDEDFVHSISPDEDVEVEHFEYDDEPMTVIVEEVQRDFA
jgi:hypothetical protein